ncbi:pilus assembly FimT family protein [Oceanicaulis sp.]|uniref:pilus assembly FimT family protein n=1 Tax=Oceanicaulis sp. TaxID=1924941 RepID=UPI003D266B61
MTGGLSRTLLAVRAGYSLLEVIVVVAILGIAATLSGPSIGRMITSQQAQQVVRGVTTEMGALRAEAFLSSASLSAQDVQTRLDAHIPPDWRIEVDEALRVASSGYCTGGVVRLVAPSGRLWTFEVSDGDCAMRQAMS